MGARLDINSIFIANFEIIKFFKLIVIENGTVKIIVYGLQDFVTIAIGILSHSIHFGESAL